MKRIIQIIAVIFFVCLILSGYKHWFLSKEIIGGDWPYMYQEVINSSPFLPPAWSPTHGNGLGGTFLVYALDSYLYFTGWLFSNILHIPWPFVYKFFYFGIFLFLAIFSVWHTLKKLFPGIPQSYRFLGIFVYLANSYILLITSGGQMGIALAYSMAPLVLLSFIKTVNKANLGASNFQFSIFNFQSIFKLSMIAGVLFSILVMFDFRIAYITLGAVGLYLVIKSSSHQAIKQSFLNTVYSIFYVLVIPLAITGLLHSFWLLPLLLIGNSSIDQLGGIYTTSGAVKFFSFARLENSLSLLHPNWPENLFGKIYFMRWEFLVLPVIAYSSLLFISKNGYMVKGLNGSKKSVTIQPSNHPIIIFFSLLGLFGAFLAKGANEPFGFIYIWLFEHVPGFIMFRDPTKWYLLIALSYSVLVPLGVYCIYQWLSKIKQFSIFNFQFSIKSKIFNFQNLFVLIFISYFLYLVHPALFGQLGGTFRHREVPKEYVALKDRLYKDPEFYRTLWIPRQQRFAYSSYAHPSIEAEPLFSATNAAELSQALKSAKAEDKLSDLGVKYIIVPFDPYGEIFIDDRKYSQKKRDEYEKVLDNIAWLKRVDCPIVKLLNCSESPFEKITMYETRKHRDLFYLPMSDSRYQKADGQLNYKVISPTNYEVTVKNVKEDDILIFAQNYSPYWKAASAASHKVIKSSSYKVGSARDDLKLNGFVLPEDGSYKINVYYSVEKYYIIGRVISGVALIAIMGLLLLSSRPKR